ncbi:MAG: hypothetical protein ACI9KE_001317 [Polyangiales bacterium]
MCYNVFMADEQDSNPRKEKVLHTRVPAVLEQELKALAQNLRVPVSNVVRTILEDALKTVDVIGRRAESELRDVAALLGPKKPYAQSAGVAPAAEGPPLAAVVGYQAIRLARDEACTLCGGELLRGSEAHLGIRDDGGARLLLGPECLPFRASQEKEEDQ